MNRAKINNQTEQTNYVFKRGVAVIFELKKSNIYLHPTSYSCHFQDHRPAAIFDDAAVYHCHRHLPQTPMVRNLPTDQTVFTSQYAQQVINAYAMQQSLLIFQMQRKIEESLQVQQPRLVCITGMFKKPTVDHKWLIR